MRRPTSGRDPHPFEPSAKADGAFGKPLAAVSNSPCTVRNVSERHRHLGGFLRVDFLANGSSPLGGMKTLKQQFNSAASGAIVHLRGRERALEGFGWAGRQAEWIALACLHGGVFTRAQWTSFLGCHHEKVRRAVRALVAQGVAVEEDPPGIDGRGEKCF